ncbi:competence type IV pilus minor pilin ComGG [Schinkia sp. CFF1]
MCVIFNQKGFILPLTMMLMFLFPLLIISEIELYKIEQRFYVEEEEIEKLQSISQIGMQDIFKLVNEEPTIQTTTGKFNYPTGYIDYSIEPLNTGSIQIKATCTTNNLRKQYFKAIMNLETKEIEKWVEE